MLCRRIEPPNPLKGFESSILVPIYDDNERHMRKQPYKKQKCE